MFALQSIMRNYEMCPEYVHSIVRMGTNEYFVIDTTLTNLRCVIDTALTNLRCVRRKYY